MRIVLIHGYKASPEMGFWPWLREELVKRGHEVIAPELPNPAEPDCEEWVVAIDKAIMRPQGDTIFIAHSLGCVALLHYLEQAEMAGTPMSSILVSPIWYVGAKRFESFFVPPVDFDTAMWKSQGFTIVHAKDDDVVPFDHALRYEKELQGQLEALDEGRHFVDAEKLPILLDLIDGRSGEPGEDLPDDFAEIEIVV